MIRVQSAGDVAHVVLDRPNRRNALTPEGIRALEAGLRGHAGHTRAILLRGEGDAFCAGFDLERCVADPEGRTMRALLAGLARVVMTMRALPCPVVVCAHGGAIAGGCALAMGADIVVTNREARIGYPVVRLGVSPAVSAPTAALRAAGGLRARMLDPGLISGEEALRTGLADECADTPEAAIERAGAIAASLAAKPRAGLAATRMWLHELETAGRKHIAGQALAASLALVGGDEERRMLTDAWTGRKPS